MRATALLPIFLIWGAVAPFAGAQEVAISGRVVDEEGRAATGVEVRLVPILDGFGQAVLELSGIAVPEAVTTQRTGDHGDFRLTAPEPGFWRVIVETPGYARMELTFRREPLFEATTVPELQLQAARTVTVRVEDPDGTPATGAWIETWVTAVKPRRSRAPSWRTHTPPQRSLPDSATSIVVPSGHDIELQAWQRGFVASEKVPTEGSSARLRLGSAVARRLLLTDSAGAPLPGAVIGEGEGEWPASRTGPDGLVTLHGSPEGAQATILLADGRAASIRLTADEGLDDRPFEFPIADFRLLSGRVVDAETRKAVAGAFVYLSGAARRHVKTGVRGGFELPVQDQNRVGISAVAPGFLRNGALADAATSTITIALDAAINLPGFVLDPAGEPLAGAEILARPYGDSMQELRALVRGPNRQATSDAAGAFVVPRLKEGLGYSIAARLDGFAPAEAIVRDLEAVANAGGVVLTLESGTTLTGRVLAPDGRGIAGANLTLERSDANEAMRYVNRVPRQAKPFRFEFATDAEGEFSFADTPRGEFNLEVQAPGFAVEVVPVFEIEVGVRTHDVGIIDLEPGVELAGRIVDPEGLPLDGAKISLSTRQGVMFSGSFGADVQATSAADGQFSFSDRRRGEFLDLSVELAGYASKEVLRVDVPQESLLEIALEPAVTLRGRVLDPGGQPITGASVSVAREGGGSSYGGRVYTSPDAQARSDELGRFALADIEPGTVRVSAGANGWLGTELGDLELSAGSEPEELEIELRPGATVSGRVLGPDGSPLSEAMVGVQESPNMRFSNAVSDGDGNYSLGGVEPGKRRIGAHHDGQQTVQEIEVEPGDNRLDFYFEAGVEVSGSVVSPAGDSVEGAVLSLSAIGVRSYRGNRSARSDAAGAFKLENVSPGLVELTVEHPAFGSTTLEEPLEVGTASISGLLIRLAAGVEVIGSVLGATPEDLVSLELVAIGPQGRIYKEGRIDSDGGYRIANLSPGAWQIWAQSGTGRRTVEPLEIEEGETQVVLDLEFKDGLVLSGRVSNRGEPVGGAWVSAAGTDIEAGSSAQTNHEGRFRISGLEAGTYALQVIGFSSGLSHSEEIELRRDEEILIELDGSTISGQVTDQRGHGGLPGAAIVLEEVAHGDREPSRFPRGATTDARGRFRLSDVSPGSYRIRATKAGYATQTQVLDLGEDAEEEVEFALEEVSGLSLTVLLPSDAPANQIAYAVLDLAGSVIQSGRETATREGLVRLATVPDGDWSVMIEAAGAALRVVRTQAPREKVTVRLERAATLAVRVEELVHDATTVATLRVTGADGLTFKSLAWNGGTVDQWRLSAGRVALANLPAGRWILSITTADGRSWERSVSLAAGNNDEEVFD